MIIINDLQIKLQKHKKILLPLLICYLIFNSCFTFPLIKSFIPTTTYDIFMLLWSYGLISFIFIFLLGKINIFNFFILTFTFITTGLIFRYFLEYGEVSNTVNFTSNNIILFLTIVPIYCTIIYYFFSKKLL